MTSDIQPEPAILYTQDQIREDLRPDEGGNSMHLTLYRTETGGLSARLDEGVLNGQIINRGNETMGFPPSSNFTYPVVRSYQGLASWAARSLAETVHNHQYSFQKGNKSDADPEIYDERILKPNAKGIQLVRVRDEGWVGGYKWSPDREE